MMISFDIIAGRTKRAPIWMQKSGLEWCYRIYQEPRRMWKRYAKTNPVFVWMVLKEYVKRMAQRAKSSKRSTDFADFRRFKDKEKHSAKDKEKLKAKQLENSRIRVLFISEPIN